MTTYKANRYYSTMTCTMFLVLGTDEDVLREANELFMESIAADEDNDDFMDFVNLHHLLYFDDADEPLYYGTIETGLDVIIKDSKAYVYRVVTDYQSRF